MDLRERIRGKNLSLVFGGIFNDLCYRTVNQSGLSLMLYETKVVTVEERRYCMAGQTPYEQNERLYTLVMKKNAGGQLVSALTHSGNYKIVELLTHRLLSEYQGEFDQDEFNGKGRPGDQLYSDESIAKSSNAPTWSNVLELQKILMDFQNQIEKNKEEMTKLKKQHSYLKSAYDDLIMNPVPIGFVYTQLPGHPEPTQMWPHLTWTDVSAEHAGHFFRVVGGNSQEFGTSQESACSGSLQEIRSRSYLWPDYDKSVNEYRAQILKEPKLSLPSSQTVWCGRVFSGAHNSHSYPEVWMDILVSSADETRPKNQAVKIWKRTG